MFEMEKLPFKFSALEPYMSARTLEFHYGKHYKGYIDKLNELIKDTAYAQMTLAEIIRQSYRQQPHKAIYNNAGQVWNHEFFWRSLSSSGPETPPTEILDKIKQAFGSLDDFKAEFKNKAAAIFGSGWCWVVQKDNRLKIEATSNADNPLSLDLGQPLLCLDVWEHAYYLDYQNRRVDFIDAFLNHLMRWQLNKT